MAAPRCSCGRFAHECTSIHVDEMSDSELYEFIARGYQGVTNNDELHLREIQLNQAREKLQAIVNKVWAEERKSIFPMKPQKDRIEEYSKRKQDEMVNPFTVTGMFQPIVDGLANVSKQMTKFTDNRPEEMKSELEPVKEEPKEVKPRVRKIVFEDQ